MVRQAVRSIVDTFPKENERRNADETRRYGSSLIHTLGLDWKVLIECLPVHDTVKWVGMRWRTNWKLHVLTCWKLEMKTRRAMFFPQSHVTVTDKKLAGSFSLNLKGLNPWGFGFEKMYISESMTLIGTSLPPSYHHVSSPKWSCDSEVHTRHWPIQG